MAPAVLAREEEAETTRQARRSRAVGGASAQRARLVRAVGELVTEVGISATGVHHVCQRAGMSRRTFYDLYEHREACFMDALGDAYGRLLEHVEQAVEAAGSAWEERAVALTQTLVGALAADRALAHLCMAPAMAGDQHATRLRREALDRLVALLADAPEVEVPTDLVLAGALGGVWELVHRSLAEGVEPSVAADTEAAVYLMLAPFVGRRRATLLAGQGTATALVTRWTPAADSAAADRCGVLLTELTRQTLLYLAEHPDASNIDIARGIDVRHESQISRHLVRLERAGVVCRRKQGRTNAWRLTASGQEAVEAVCRRDEGLAYELSMKNTKGRSR